MGLDQLGVLTVGTLSPRGVDTPCFTAPCLSFPPGLKSHRSWLDPQGHNIRAYPMQHVVNKAHTRWVAANLISGYLVHAGNQGHGTAGHNLSWYTLIMSSCQHNSAHRPWEVRKQRGLRVKGLNFESQSAGKPFT